MSNLRTRTMVLALAEFTNTGLTALMVIVLTRLLAKDLYGTYRQVLLAHSLIAIVLGTQIAESLLYFLPRASAREKPLWLSQTVLLSGCAGVVLAAVLFFGADAWGAWTGNALLPDLVRVFALFPLADRVARVVPLALVADGRAGAASVYSVALGLIKVGSAIGPAAAGWSVSGILWTTIVCWFGAAAGGLAWLRLDSGLRLCAPTTRAVREQLGYVAPLLVGNSAGALHEQLGQLLASVTLSTALYAEYAVGAVQIPLVGIWIASIASASMPDLVRLAAQGDTRRMVELWHRGMRKGALVVFPLLAWAFVVPDELMRALYGPAYAGAALPFVVFLVALVPRITNYGVVFRALGHTRPVVVWTAAGLAVNVLVGVVLSSVGGGTRLAFVAPAIGYVAGHYVTVFVVLLLMSHKLHMRMADLLPLSRITPLAGLSALAALFAAAARLLPVSRWTTAAAQSAPEWSWLADPSVTAGIRCAAVAIAFAIAFLVLGGRIGILEKQERAILARVARMVLSRFPTPPRFKR